MEKTNNSMGFVILCTEPNLVYLKNTVKCVKQRCCDTPIIGVVTKDTPIGLIEQMKEICLIYRGKNTHTSLINTGLRNCPTDWAIFLISGTWVKRNLAVKYPRFIKSDTDVLYPIVLNEKNWVYSFKNSTLNGLFINKKTFKNRV